jgi:ATP-binding cassette subfamily B protein
MVFDAGRILETGTFNDLVQAGGRFASLARTQLIAAEPAA